MTKIYSTAQENSSKPIAQEDKRIVADKLLEEGYTFPMASHHVSEQKVWDFFVALFDGNEFAAAGACGNMQHESGLYSDNAEDLWNETFHHTDTWLTDGINNGDITLAQFLQRSWYVNNYGFGYGLSQWTTATRRTWLWERTIDVGLDIDNEDAQLDYIEWEFTDTDSPYEPLRAGMIACRTVEEATRYYCTNYEGGSWSAKRLQYANYFYDTYASVGGNSIYITVNGNGTAYVNKYHPADRETFTLFAYPASGETLDDITATTSTGASIAMELATEWDYIYDETNWGNFINITVDFSGTPPVPPQTYLQEKRMPIWMYPAVKYKH